MKRTRSLVWPQRTVYAGDTRTLILDGYPYKLSTRDGHLSVTQHGTENLYPRAVARKTTTGLTRIIVVSDQGYITGAAFTWCRMMDVNIIHCNRENKSSFISGPESTDAQLVKRQVMAQPGMPNAQIGLEITRSLLTEKIAGQREIMTRMEVATTRIDGCLKDMATANAISSMLAYEGGAAMSYWAAWKERVFVPWLPSVLNRVPSNWHRFNRRATFSHIDGRTSAENQNASDFCNSLLNVAYHFALIEAIFACRMFGLHTHIGFSHSIDDNVPALALDITEVLRPIADVQVLSTLDYGNGLPITDTGKPLRWDKNSAQECDNGECRLSKDTVWRIGAAVSLACAPVAIATAESIARTLTTDRPSLHVASFDPRLKTAKSSTTLDDDLTEFDLIPDNIWIAVAPFIPEHGGKFTRTRVSDPRKVLAGVLCHELYGVPWPKIPSAIGLAWTTYQRRYDNWVELGAWDAIRAEVTRPGISQQQIS